MILSESVSELLAAISDEQRVFLLLGILLDKEFAKELLASDSRTSSALLPLVDRLVSLSPEIRIPLALTLLRESLHAIENVSNLVDDHLS